MSESNLQEEYLHPKLKADKDYEEPNDELANQTENYENDDVAMENTSANVTDTLPSLNETNPSEIQNELKGGLEEGILDYDKLYRRFLKCITIPQFEESMITEDHKMLIFDFFKSKDHCRLLISIDHTMKPAVLNITTNLASQHGEMFSTKNYSKLVCDSVHSC
jgi:hypothetical protein